MKKPRHVISDLSEVMILGLGGNDGPLARGLQLDEQQRYGALGGDSLLSFLRGQCSEEEYLSSVTRDNQWKIEPASLGRLIRENFEVSNAETISLMRQLSGSCELTLLSDHAREWVETILEVHPFIKELFKTRIFSYETGYIKREPEMFRFALGQIGADPSDCLFIDDSAANVACARALGIDAIQYLETHQLARELSQRNLLEQRNPAGFERGIEI